MTPEQSAAIAARNAARTQGKWLGMNMVNIDGSSMTAENIGEYVKNSVKKTAEVQKVERFLFVTIDGDNQPDICHVGNGPMGPHNAAFIAHASEDIPSLLAEVARLTAALTEAEKRHVDLHRLAYSWMVAHDKLKAGKPYAFPSPLEPDAITKLETTAYQHGYDAAKEQAMQAVEDAGWYRSSDDAVSWDAQDEQVQYSIAAIAAMVKP